MDVNCIPENGTSKALRLVDSLERRQQVLGEVFAGVAHDLANVFTFVVASVELLAYRLRDNSDPVVVKHLGLLQDSMDDACKMLRGLTAFSSGRNMPANYLVDVACVAEEVLTWARNRSEANGSASRVDFVLDCSTHKLPLVWGNVLSMKRLLTNLVLNAIEAMPDGGRLTISVRSQKDKVCLSVTDTGHGMGTDTIHRLFEPYFTTPKGNGSARREGIGLGLSNVQQLAAAHGGETTVESVPGQGTTFNVSFPAFFAEEVGLPSPENGDKSTA